MFGVSCRSMREHREQVAQVLEASKLFKGFNLKMKFMRRRKLVTCCHLQSGPKCRRHDETGGKACCHHPVAEGPA